MNLVRSETRSLRIDLKCLPLISPERTSTPSLEDEPTYVELPPEPGAPAGTYALLKRHMYGTQLAAD